MVSRDWGVENWGGVVYRYKLETSKEVSPGGRMHSMVTPVNNAVVYTSKLPRDWILIVSTTNKQ